ncbi:unnamed protein product [Rhizoctonia solani]|uniref:Uncharacterized protein n=1 Tax=Rhizoctonia solani TaxID=456999 RepID=A0A8H3BJD3_9AGAM|nr:unnamed protein product [Rhizoctonia solani]
MDQDLLDSFDFIHPSNIIRAVHLIPDFQSGHSNDLLTFPKSISHNSDEHWDWRHYLNRFVDHILMHYLGGGIGHYPYTIHGSKNNLDSEQNDDKNKDAESEEERDDVESEDERTSVGNESICLTEDEVSDKEESNINNSTKSLRVRERSRAPYGPP